MTGGCESPRQTPSLAYVHSISRRSLARQGSLGFRPGAARRYEFALGRGIGLLRVEQFDQRGFAGPVGQLREAQGFTRLTDAASFESGDPRLSRAQGRPRVGDFSLRVGEHAVAACRSEEHTSELQSLMSISYAVCCLKK